MERFWDTMKTFHFPWGEITITPLDFCMLRGVPFSCADLLVHHDQAKEEFRQLFGLVGACITTSLIRLTVFQDALT